MRRAFANTSCRILGSVPGFASLDPSYPPASDTDADAAARRFLIRFSTRQEPPAPPGPLRTHRDWHKRNRRTRLPGSRQHGAFRDRNGRRNPRRLPLRSGQARGRGRAQLCAHPPPRRSGHLHRATRGNRGRRRGEGAGARRRNDAAALRHPGRGQGQHRRQGPADHGGMPGIRLSAGQGRDRRREACARRARSFSARPISISSRPAWSACARPTASPRNLFDAKLIPGGSSSGSAVAVGAGLVPLALGTDTAGSGRVPAAFSNVVGLKPSRGLVSAAGVVPACRTLDCVSIFALHRRRRNDDAERDRRR